MWLIIQRDMQQNTQIHADSFDEISIKKFVNEVLSFIIYLLKKWYWIVLGFALLGGMRYQQISQIKATYPARIKLFVRPQNIAKENKLVLTAYSQLISSRSLLEELFLEKVNINDQEELLINIYLKTYYELKPEGIDSDIPLGYELKGNNLDELSIEELTVFGKIVEKAMTPASDYSDGFVAVSADYDLGFITINVSTPTTELSLLMLDRLYGIIKKMLPKLNDYPFEIAFSILEAETDSLSANYKETYYQLNVDKDKRERLLKDSTRAYEVKKLEKKIHRLEVDAEVYNIEYLAALEQLKVSQLDMNQNSLLVHEVERTLPPVSAYQPSPIVEGIKWGISGAVLSIVFIVFVRIFMNLYKELK
jgi:hypothetical protein